MIGQPAARSRTDRDASEKPAPKVGAKPKESRPAKARPAPVAKPAQPASGGKPAQPASGDKPARPVFEGKPAFFLGVGFTRCGTSWLHQQLTHHPHIWVPPIKELHYWTRQRRYGVWDKYYKLHFQQMRSMSRFDVRKESERNQQRFDKYLQDHGRWALRYFLGWRCDRWYRSLFPKTGYAACGEITPNYVQMTDRQMAAVHRFDPAAKIIILLRNPIDRAWSMVAKHRLRKAGDAADQVEDETLYTVSLELARTMEYWPLIAKWQRVFGKPQVHIGWYDQIDTDKPAFLAGLAEFLGVDPAPFGANRRVLEKRQNAVDYGKRRMPEELRREMSRLALPMTEQLAEAEGGYAVAWAEEMRAVAAD